jgi:nascent polypeptide-associated complex subunit beta
MDAEKLARLQKSVRIGGKGTPRRKVKRTTKTEGDDKKLQATLQKLNAQAIPGIEAVSMFKDDGKVLQFQRPVVQASVPSNTYAIYGSAQEKDASELIPDVLQSMGPESIEQLRKLTEQLKANDPATKEAEDDDIPDLVEGESFEDKVD